MARKRSNDIERKLKRLHAKLRKQLAAMRRYTEHPHEQLIQAAESNIGSIENALAIMKASQITIQEVLRIAIEQGKSSERPRRDLEFARRALERSDQYFSSIDEITYRMIEEQAKAIDAIIRAYTK